MKHLFFLAVIVAQAVFTQCRAADNEPLTVITFNIRYGTAPDGENSWPERQDLVFDVLRENKPLILGMQEVLREQLDEILHEFPQYSAVGVGREADGAGEYSPLLYDRSRFDVLEAETFWLSETPEVRASKSWGNEITRICTWARLLDRTNNRVLRVYNTHWDHISQPSRVKSGELISQKLQENDNAEPVIVMGDFNIGPLGPAREPFDKAGLRDSLVDLFPDQARAGTFHAFSGKPNSDKIDAILISSNWQVLAAEIIRTQRDGRFPSDHFPVTATLRLNAVD